MIWTSKWFQWAVMYWKAILIILVVTLFVLAFAWKSYGDNLVCDPQAGVMYYVVIDNESPVKVVAQADGSLKMENVDTTHIYMAAACNSAGCSRTTNIKPSDPKDARIE